MRLARQFAAFETKPGHLVSSPKLRILCFGVRNFFLPERTSHLNPPWPLSCSPYSAPVITRLLPAFLLATFALSASADAPWQPLFNGKNLDGWRIECREKDRAKTYWRAIDGAIECDTRGDKDHDYVWLLSEKEFGDFEFRCLVQTFADSPGNSGIQIRSRFLEHPEKGHWLHGPQVDIHPPGPYRCGFIYDETWETRRWIFPPLPSAKSIPEWGPAEWFWNHAGGQRLGRPIKKSRQQAAPNGWNTMHITARGPQIAVTVNGFPVTRFDGTGILDDAAHRSHQVGTKGHLALQLHGKNNLRIRFKDPQIRELAPAAVKSSVTVVRNDSELQSALSKLGPGSTVRIAPGRYQPGVIVRDAHGTPDQPIVIEGLDPRDPPLFEGGSQAWHLSDVSHLTLRWIRCRDHKHNGINLDDGGSYDTPSHHVTLAHLDVQDVGPRGNFDAIKCSGVDHLKILDCNISGWGGQAIDFVGCHHAEIARCTITGKDGYSQSTGPQFKGGSSDVHIHHCRLVNAGMRPIQAGGSTGLDFFRPKDAPFEAARIRIEDNTISGGECAVSFAGVDGCDFTHNTILNPEKWIARILQESRDERFAKCGNVRFDQNLVVFERKKIRYDINIGPDTKPETFSFTGNHWFASDEPARSKPDLPVAEKDTVHGKDPKLNPKTGKPAASEAGAR